MSDESSHIKAVWAVGAGRFLGLDPFKGERPTPEDKQAFKAAFFRALVIYTETYEGRYALRQVLERFAEADKDLLALERLNYEQLKELYEKHCECRPTDMLRETHSHDCYCDTLDEIARVVKARDPF